MINLKNYPQKGTANNSRADMKQGEEMGKKLNKWLLVNELIM